MSTFFLFCPGSLNSKKQKSKSKEKKKHSNLQPTSPVDPLYETIPAQTKYSHSNRGRHTFESTGKPPASLNCNSRNAACVQVNYSPTNGSHQDLSVASGQIVHILQQNQEWSYVIDETNKMGYVPSDILSPAGGRDHERWKHNSNSNCSANTGTPTFHSARSDNSKSTPQSPATPPESLYSKVNKRSRSARSAPNKPISNLVIATSPPQSGLYHNSFASFSKGPLEVRTLLYSYRSVQENDLTVRKGEQVTVLNSSDPDWLWVVRGDGEEGFIPTSHAVPASSHVPGSVTHASHSRHSKLSKQHSSSTGYRSLSSSTNSNQLSAAFSDRLRITPFRSTPQSKSPADGDRYLHTSSEPTFDKQRRGRHRKSPDRKASREVRCTTPNSLIEKRANSLEYIDRKRHDSFSHSGLQRTTSSQHPRPCHSPGYAPSHSQSHFLYPQSAQLPTRPAPAPPEDEIYENLNAVNPKQRFVHQYPHVVLQENIYMNAPRLDANGKPSLVASIMTMQDRIQLMDKQPIHLPHSNSDFSIGQSSSLGDSHSVSEFNQHHLASRLLKEDVV